MTPKQLARVEMEARRMRAEVLSGWVRNLFHRAPRTPIAPVRAA